jgi:hypothetical protein
VSKKLSRIPSGACTVVGTLSNLGLHIALTPSVGRSSSNSPADVASRLPDGRTAIYAPILANIWRNICFMRQTDVPYWRINLNLRQTANAKIASR